MYTYNRGTPPTGGGLPSGTSYLRCGNDAWGLRHIDLRHSSDWGTIASRVGGDWESFADWAVGVILSAPESASYNSGNDTYGYTAPIEIRDPSGEVVGNYRPLVSVAAGSGNIITAFPRSA
ncbi:hypothetical protein GCM10027079_29730 [Sediminivirga luteola]|uniref:Uncharacterized protein n=1 Tax=Sediminivirga luteola TaxID=1774748 RepID=A0A8J2U046_9MICO|nr:hypothetical protein GCM10011333_27760 [Sediminivirga luteola]